MCHKMLTQHSHFLHHFNTKNGMLSQHFMMHVVPLGCLDQEKGSEGCSKSSQTHGVSGSELWLSCTQAALRVPKSVQIHS